MSADICFVSEFVPMRSGVQVRTLLRVKRWAWMQESREPFKDGARKRHLSKRERERWKWIEEAMEAEARVHSRNDLCSSVDDMKQKKR